MKKRKKKTNNNKKIIIFLGIVLVIAAIIGTQTASEFRDTIDTIGDTLEAFDEIVWI